MKGGISWKLITLAFDRYPCEFYLRFLSRDIYIKLCQMYTKIHKYTISYSFSRFKKIIFSKYATNLKTKISQRKLIVTKLYIYEFLYKFYKVLYHFIEKGTSDWTFVGHDQELKWLAFTTPTPFHFSKTVPLNVWPLKSLTNIKLSSYI